MSQIGDTFTSTPGNTSKKLRIDQNAQKLLIVRTAGGDGNRLTTWPTTGHLLTRLTERISLEIQGLGSARLSQGERIPLGPIAAFAQYGEGVITESVVGIAPNTVCTTYLPVVLASVGVELQAGDNSFIFIENAPVGCTYTVFAIQTPTTGNLVYEYMQQSVLGGDKHRKIDVSAVMAAVLPVQGLGKLIVTYNGGRQCEYTPLELSFINSENNDIESMMGTPTTTELQGSIVSGSLFSEAIVLKLGVITQLEVYTDGNLYEYVTVAEIDRSAK